MFLCNICNEREYETKYKDDETNEVTLLCSVCYEDLFMEGDEYND